MRKKIDTRDFVVVLIVLLVEFGAAPYLPTDARGPANTVCRVLSGDRMDALVSGPPTTTLDGTESRDKLVSPGHHLEPIQSQPANVQRLAKAVALLFIVKDNGTKPTCTGFLVSAGILLTANHCVESDREMRSARALFDFDDEKSATVQARFKEFIVTQSSKDLDYRLLRLNTTVSGRTPLVVDTNTTAFEGEKLLLIGHPDGGTTQVSRLGCAVHCPLIGGLGGQLTDFGHLCDTDKGSSGSPVLDDSSLKLVGLHHFDDSLAHCLGVKQGVHIRKIWESIKSDDTVPASLKTELGITANGPAGLTLKR